MRISASVKMASSHCKHVQVSDPSSDVVLWVGKMNPLRDGANSMWEPSVLFATAGNWVASSK